MIASDGLKRHPRNAGAYARILGLYVRERGELELMDDLRKISLMPTMRLEKRVPGMKNKGRIKVGLDADLTLFDPKTVIDKATFTSSTTKKPQLHERESRLFELRDKRGICSGNFGAFVAENFDGAIELVVFDRLFNDGDRAAGKDFGQDLAVGIPGDDHDGKIGILGFQLCVQFVTGNIGQLQVKENQVKTLLFGVGKSFRAGPDDDATESCFLEELLEESLQRGVIVHYQDGGLATLIGLEDVAIQKAAFDTPASPDLNGGELTSLHKIINGGKRNSEIFRSLFHGHEFRGFFV